MLGVVDDVLLMHYYRFPGVCCSQAGKGLSGLGFSFSSSGFSGPAEEMTQASALVLISMFK